LNISVESIIHKEKLDCSYSSKQ